MKKEEAREISIKRADLIMEYIYQILSDSEVVVGRMNFGTKKIDGQMMEILDIYVPSKGFERHFNLGITSDHNNVLYEELLNRFRDELFSHETIGVTNIHTLKSNFSSFEGVVARNTTGSKIKIDMLGINEELKSKFSQAYTDFEDSLNKEKDNNKKIKS